MQFRLKAIITIARVIRECPMRLQDKRAISIALANMFEEDNPTFDKRKFLGIANSIINDAEMDMFIKQRKL